MRDKESSAGEVILTLVRGPASKTEISLVDKIELARAYQDITGKRSL